MMMSLIITFPGCIILLIIAVVCQKMKRQLNSTTSLVLKKLDEYLNCCLCLEQYSNPRVLPCHHCYCYDCLRGLCLASKRDLVCYYYYYCISYGIIVVCRMPARLLSLVQYVVRNGEYVEGEGLALWLKHSISLL